MANWSDVNPDLLVAIAKHVTAIRDFVAFGRVCRSWRSAATLRNFTNLVQIPSLMLTNDDQNSDTREFYSLYDYRVRELTLPEANGKSCLSSQGWLLTLGRDMEVNLLNPVTRAIIELPSLTTFPNFEEQRVRDDCMQSMMITKVVLSASPCSASDYVLMIVYGRSENLAFYKGGDKSWTLIDTYYGIYMDVVFYMGKFYAVNSGGMVLICDVNGPNPTTAEVVTSVPREYFPSIELMGSVPVEYVPFIEKLYLVELSGKLLVVSREGTEIRSDHDDNEKDTYGTTTVQVFRVDVEGDEGKKWEKVNSIGDAALFLGDNSSFSVNTHFAPCKANCIYFTDDARESYHFAKIAPDGGGKDMGIYNLLDGSFKPHFKGQSRHSLLTPPLWVVLPPTF